MSALLFLCLAAGLWNPEPAGRVVVDDRETVREIEFEDVLRTRPGEPEPAYGLAAETWFALPQDEPGQRLLGATWIVAPDTEARFDGHGNRLVRAVGDPAAAGGLRAVWRVRAALADREHRVRGEALLPVTATPPDVLSRYLHLDGRHADPGPELVAVAAAAKRAARDPLDLAFKLNEEVRARVTYDRDGRWDPAPVVWRTGRGSCSEYHFLYATLCRLAGLPCRFVGATAWRGAPNDLAYSDDVYHRWSEVYLPGYGWFPVDVSRNDGEDGEPINQAFGRTSRALLILSRGDGGEDDPLGVQYVARSEWLARESLAPAPPRLASDRVVRWRVIREAPPAR